MWERMDLCPINREMSGFRPLASSTRPRFRYWLLGFLGHFCLFPWFQTFLWCRFLNYFYKNLFAQVTKNFSKISKKKYLRGLWRLWWLTSTRRIAVSFSRRWSLIFLLVINRYISHWTIKSGWFRLSALLIGWLFWLTTRWCSWWDFFLWFIFRSQSCRRCFLWRFFLLCRLSFRNLWRWFLAFCDFGSFNRNGCRFLLVIASAAACGRTGLFSFCSRNEIVQLSIIFKVAFICWIVSFIINRFLSSCFWLLILFLTFFGAFKYILISPPKRTVQ